MKFLTIHLLVIELLLNFLLFQYQLLIYLHL